jgi:chromosomal replication initiation ATPase DnaA
MSIADTLHRAHKARLERIASRAASQGPPPAPAPAPRYAMDHDYERAWAAVILGWGGDRRRVKRRIEEIQQATAQHFGLTHEDLLANASAIALSRPRHVAMYLAREMTTMSVAEIGQAFAGRDHTTVLHAVKRVRDLLAHDDEFRRSVDSIRAALTES